MTRSPADLPTDLMPLIANLELTNRCNMRCRYCANRTMRRERADMSAETLALVMRRIDESGIRQVILNTIGETLLAPLLGEVLRESRTRGLHVLVSTNGQLLGEDVARLLLTEGCDVVRISVNAADTEAYDRLHEGGSFDRLLENVTRLRTLRDELGSDCVVRVRSVLPLDTESRREIRRDLDGFWGPIVDAVEFVTFGNMGGRAGMDPMRDERRVRCATMWRGFNVMLDGAIGYCPCDFDGETGVGSLLDKSFRQVWESEEFQAVRRAHETHDLSGLSHCSQCDATRPAWYEMKEPSVSAKEAEIMDSYLHGWRAARAAGKGE